MLCWQGPGSLQPLQLMSARAPSAIPSQQGWVGEEECTYKVSQRLLARGPHSTKKQASSCQLFGTVQCKLHMPTPGLHDAWQACVHVCNACAAARLTASRRLAVGYSAAPQQPSAAGHVGEVILKGVLALSVGSAGRGVAQGSAWGRDAVGGHNALEDCRAAMQATASASQRQHCASCVCSVLAPQRQWQQQSTACTVHCKGTPGAGSANMLKAEQKAHLGPGVAASQ